MKKTWNFVEYVFHNKSESDRNLYLFRKKWITLGEIGTIAGQMAELFMSAGLKPSERILLFLDDTPAAVGCFLGAIQAGMVPVLLNPQSKKDYIKHYIKDSKCTSIVCEPRVVSVIQTIQKSLLNDVKVWQQDLYRSANDNLHLDLKGIRTALNLSPFDGYLYNDCESDFWQYTSGTTGMPKAVRQSTQGMVENTELYAKAILNISGNDCIYSTAKLFFGYGLGNSVFFPLLRGARAILDERWPTPDIIVEIIQTNRPTILFSVPTIYLNIIDHGENITRAMGNNARYVSAGAPLPGAIFNAWRYRYNIEILDGIGATEMGHIFLSNRPGSAQAGSTGKTLKGYEVKLMTSVDTTAKYEEQGVLYVKGPSVAKGYYNDPTNTAHRFSDGWYITGDVFTQNPEGIFTYVGRQDDLFKVKGRWISPQNIESFITTHFPMIREAALIPAVSNSGDVTPVLYYATNEDQPKIKEIENHISQYLAEGFGSYVVPKEYFVISQLPKNDNGKFMRNALSTTLPQDSQQLELIKFH
ncbi:MAG: hypothetical protein COA99_03120 [Moraxellaceae bacterium]|nr:MAG: hypothetical protein COA99_03120 [Moraxellaceae bacterium]